MASVAALGHRKIVQRKHFSATLVLHTFRAIEGTFARVQDVVEAGELGSFGEGGFSLVPNFVGPHALFGAGGELYHDIVETEERKRLSFRLGNDSLQAACRNARLLDSRGRFDAFGVRGCASVLPK